MRRRKAWALCEVEGQPAIDADGRFEVYATKDHALSSTTRDSRDTLMRVEIRELPPAKLRAVERRKAKR
jgi:hypothetical protein